MVRRQTHQWMIQFSFWVNADGYEWQRSWTPGDTTWTKLLAPTDSIDQVGLDSVGRNAGTREVGVGAGRNAYRRFKKLAETITLSKPLSFGIGRKVLISDQDAGDAIREYADVYGSLWGDDDPRSLKDWQREAAAFLDLYDVAQALITADFRAFDQHVYYSESPVPCVEYIGDHAFSEAMTIARQGEIVESRASLNAVPKTDDFFIVAMGGSSRARARMLISRQMNRRLDGGLSLSLNLLDDSRAFIAPRTLIDLLYIRMWLDTLQVDELERHVVCANPGCGKTIVGTNKRRKYCSDECRWEANNRRRSALA